MLKLMNYKESIVELIPWLVALLPLTFNDCNFFMFKFLYWIIYRLVWISLKKTITCKITRSLLSCNRVDFIEEIFSCKLQQSMNGIRCLLEMPLRRWTRSVENLKNFMIALIIARVENFKEWSSRYNGLLF